MKTLWRGNISVVSVRTSPVQTRQIISVSAMQDRAVPEVAPYGTYVPRPCCRVNWVRGASLTHTVRRQRMSIHSPIGTTDTDKRRQRQNDDRIRRCRQPDAITFSHSVLDLTSMLFSVCCVVDCVAPHSD